MNEEIKRLLNVLRTAMKILDITNREVEKKLGLSYGYLSRLFAGAIELKMEHILEICDAIGLRPVEFFHLAYPRVPVPGTPAATKLRDVLQGFQPQAPGSGQEPELAAEAQASQLEPVPPGLSHEEIERMMLASLRKLLAELGKA
jgi:transcriptional regulator with XRE-family HTH domain